MKKSNFKRYNFCHLVPSASFTELVGQLGGSELVAKSVLSPELAGNSSVWPLSPNLWAFSLVLSEHLWISQGTPSISKIILPAALGNGATPVLQPRLPGNPGDGTCSLQPFLEPIKVFSWSTGARQGRWAISPWVAVQSCTHPGLPHGDIPSISTWSRGSFFYGKCTGWSCCKYIFLFSFYCASVFQSEAELEETLKDAMSYSMKSCLAETWGQKPVLQPNPRPGASPSAPATPTWGHFLFLNLP